jgi:hypothetical protein
MRNCFNAVVYWRPSSYDQSMTKSVGIVATMAILLIVLVACVSHQKMSACQSADWYEIGRQEGASGHTADTFAPHRDKCRGEAKPNFEAQFMNGRDRGLIEYCTPENGFAAGKSGALYYYVCPFNLEEDFLRHYRRGSRVLALQKDNLRLDHRMGSLFSELRSPASKMSQQDLQRELLSLRQARARNERELVRLTAGIAPPVVK